MAYSASLAQRVRHVLGRRRGLEEKKMFGGVTFLLDGNICVGIWQTSLIARLGAEQASAALQQPDVSEFDITGRPMRGWVLISADGVETDQQLARWVQQAMDFVSTLPAK